MDQYISTSTLNLGGLGFFGRQLPQQQQESPQDD